MKIFKYQLEITDEQTVLMPIGANILSLQLQNGIPCVWALVDEISGDEERTFFTYGTGNPIDPFSKSERKFLGTYQLNNGLVFHVFYI